jgi:hypothetical protein
LSYEEFEGIRTISARWAVFLRVLQKDGIEAVAGGFDHLPKADAG